MNDSIDQKVTVNEHCNFGVNYSVKHIRILVDYAIQRKIYLQNVNYRCVAYRNLFFTNRLESYQKIYKKLIQITKFYQNVSPLIKNCLLSSSDKIVFFLNDSPFPWSMLDVRQHRKCSTIVEEIHPNARNLVVRMLFVN